MQGVPHGVREDHQPALQQELPLDVARGLKPTRFVALTPVAAGEAARRSLDAMKAAVAEPSEPMQPAHVETMLEVPARPGYSAT